MLVYQKTMFERYYCIKSFCNLKTLGKRFEKFIFVLLQDVYIMARKSMKDSLVLNKPVSEKRLTPS